MIQQHETAKTEYLDVSGTRIAYRCFGADTRKPPLVFMQHYYGNMEHWDPSVTNGFAHDRKVILFGYQGVGFSDGVSPSAVEDLATATTAFIEALGFNKVDMLGFSLGGMIAQELCLRNMPSVGRVILLSTGPRGGEGMEFAELDGGRPPSTEQDLLSAFFAQSESSQQAGREYIARTKLRSSDRDLPPSKIVAENQLVAIRDWGKQRSGERYADLSRIKHPTLVVTGLRDTVAAALPRCCGTQATIEPLTSHRVTTSKILLSARKNLPMTFALEVASKVVRVYNDSHWSLRSPMDQSNSEQSERKLDRLQRALMPTH